MRRRTWQFVFIPVTLIVVGLCLLMVVGMILFMANPFGFGGSDGHFPNALTAAVPTRSPDLGYERDTAEYLDATDHGRDWDKRLRYVDATTPSTGNLVVSVNPIDGFTWSAVAKSSTGRCYALLVVAQVDHPQYGYTRYARLPRGTPCTATNATRETVRLHEPPA